VLCISLDTPSSFSLWFKLGNPPQPTFASRSPLDYPINLHDIKEKTRAVAASLHTVSDWDGKETFFKESIDSVRDEYDFILIDGLSLFGLAVLRACALSDLVIIAGGLNIYEPQNLRRLAQQIALTQACFQRPQQHVRSVLSYRVAPDEEELQQELSPEEIENLRDCYVKAYTQPLLPPLFKTEIRADEAYEHAVCNCQSVITCQPESQTVAHYISLAGELLSLFELANGNKEND
jgi:cellulose biosynthesis protein BcsQ